ncbi:MAG TPA: histidine kinase, partial [Candidatus Accumulibacter sp.]|nr:histidine kinase [Accumulibacter sp.]
AAAAADRQAAEVPAALSHLLLREDLRRIRFAGPPGTLPRIPYASLLQGNVPPELVAGRIVLIGVTATGLGDFVPTPVSAESQPMPGVEVLANVLLAMRDGQLIRDLPRLPAL